MLIITGKVRNTSQTYTPGPSQVQEYKSYKTDMYKDDLDQNNINYLPKNDTL